MTYIPKNQDGQTQAVNSFGIERNKHRLHILTDTSNAVHPGPALSSPLAKSGTNRTLSIHIYIHWPAAHGGET
jgi:hypothetical protein